MVHARYGENNFVNLSDVNFLWTQCLMRNPTKSALDIVNKSLFQAKIVFDSQLHKFY